MRTDSQDMAIFLLRLCLALLLSVQMSSAQTVCNSDVMGKPDFQDCLGIVNGLPFAKDVHGGGKFLDRAFVEPQFLPTPFMPVQNPFPLARMVQIPKIWRRSEYSPGRLFHSKLLIEVRGVKKPAMSP